MSDLPMESSGIIPIKKSRSRLTKSTSDSKIVECIREFKLPQTFPSKVKQQKSVNRNITFNKINLPTSVVSPTASQISNGESNNSKLFKNLQKLKLKSPDGRHLGEFDVQILPQVNNDNKNISLSVNSPLIKMNETLMNVNTGMDKSKFYPEMMRISSNGIIDGVSNSLSSRKYRLKSNIPFNLDGQEKSTQGVIIPVTPHMTNSNVNQYRFQTVNDPTKNNKTYVVQSENNWQVITLGNKGKCNIQTALTPIIIQSPPKNEIEMNVTKEDSIDRINTQDPGEQNSMVLETIQYPSHKSIKPSNYGNIQIKQSLNKTNHINKVRLIGTKRSSDVVLPRPCSKETKLNSIIDGDANAMNVENVNTSDSKNSSDTAYKKYKIENNVTNSRQSYPLRNSHGTVNLIRKGKKNTNTVATPYDSKNSVILTAESVHSSTDSISTMNSSKNIDNICNDDMSSRLSIVGQALSMISDDELRIKALQALADCGIGIERLVPNKPKLDQMSIKESQTQTSVFGLLDQNDFIRVTGEADSLIRLQEIERHIIVNDTNISNKPSWKSEKFFQGINRILDQQWVNKVNVDQVKEILKINPLVEKAYRLIEHDFKNAKIYDKHGLLSIHRAILSQQARAVKRQLLVLRSCKQSIDLHTLNDETGLELGIKNSVSPEIINLLLKSGAKPTSCKSAHDSALTIAAKDSSYFLSQLMKYVTSSSALNNKDSEGYTALHYCVRNNNIDGVSALIRANADVNVRDLKSGRTPLFHALENDFLDIAKELLANGARANIPNFSGHTVFALFDEDKHYSLKDALNKSVK